jgi:Tol biopolymer transport system component
MKRAAGVVAAAFLGWAAPASAVSVTTVATAVRGVSISSDGTAVALESFNDLEPADEDLNGFGSDDGGGLFRTATGSGAFTRIARLVSVNNGRSNSVVNMRTAAISPDGSTVAGQTQRSFVTGTADNPGPVIAARGPGGDRIVGDYAGDSPPRLALSRDGSHVAWDSYSQATRLSTIFYDGRQVVTGGYQPSLSYDGRLLAYTLRTGQNDYKVHVRDMATGKDRVVSSDARNKAGQGYDGQISGDGRWVAFRSAAVLVPGAGIRWVHVYVKDLKTKRIKIATLNTKGHLAKGQEFRVVQPFLGSPSPRISADGRFVAFVSRAPLVKGDSGTTPDLFVKDMQTGGIVLLPLGGRTLLEDDFRLSGNGHFLMAASITPATGTDSRGDLYSLTGDKPFCETPVQHVDGGLDTGDKKIVVDGLRPRQDDVKKSVAALDADTRAHPGNKATNAKLLSELRAMQQRYGTRASAAATDDELTKLIDDAKCTLLDDAKSNLRDYLRSKGHGDKLDLADQLSTMRDVLKGDATDAEKQKLLEENVTDLIDKLGGKDAATRFSGPTLRAYSLIKAHLEGTLDKEVKKQLRKELITQFKKASKKWLGRDAPELVDRLLDLRDVLSGSVDAKQRAQMLQDSLASLAKKLLGNGILNAPQVRAAMFGFELGRAFGERLAADLDLIANKTLAGDCAAALGPSQSTPGAIDYSKPATGTVPNGLWHEGWRCDILPEAFVQGTAGGLVQATKPANASTKNKILWRITSTEPTVTYDPSYSR